MYFTVIEAVTDGRHFMLTLTTIKMHYKVTLLICQLLRSAADYRISVLIQIQTVLLYLVSF